jgi:hypothetical protein
MVIFDLSFISGLFGGDKIMSRGSFKVGVVSYLI